MKNANLWHSISYSLVIHYSVHSVFNVYAINTLFITFVKHKSRMVFFFKFHKLRIIEEIPTAGFLFSELKTILCSWQIFIKPSLLTRTLSSSKVIFLCLISGWTLKQCKKRRTITLMQIMLKHTYTYSYIP